MYCRIQQVRIGYLRETHPGKDLIEAFKQILKSDRKLKHPDLQTDKGSKLLTLFRLGFLGVPRPREWSSLYKSESIDAIVMKTRG